MNRNERRQYKRIFFSIKDAPVAIFNHSDIHGKIIVAPIMDLSSGGLGLSLEKDKGLICVGQRLSLVEIQGIINFESIGYIETDVRWLKNYEGFKHMLFGCEFLNIPEDVAEKIQQYINSWSTRS